jgi:hypothetical protein
MDGRVVMILHLVAKCDDRCNVTIEDEGEEVFRNEADNVIEGLGIGAGDYVRLSIDTDTGKILNYPPPYKIIEVLSLLNQRKEE